MLGGRWVRSFKDGELKQNVSSALTICSGFSSVCWSHVDLSNITGGGDGDDFGEDDEFEDVPSDFARGRLERLRLALRFWNQTWNIS